MYIYIIYEYFQYKRNKEAPVSFICDQPLYKTTTIQNNHYTKHPLY